MISRLAFLLTIVVAAMLPGIARGETPVDDSGRYQLVFVGDSVEVTELFRNHAGLRSLAAKCAIHHFKADSTIFQARYANSMPAGSSQPALIFARPDSGVLYLATRDSLPTTGDALFDVLKSAYRIAGEGPDAAEVRDGGRGRLGGRLIDTLDKLPALTRDLSGINESLSRLKSDSLILIALAVIAAMLLAILLTPNQPKS